MTFSKAKKIQAHRSTFSRFFEPILVVLRFSVIPQLNFKNSVPTFLWYQKNSRVKDIFGDNFDSSFRKIDFTFNLLELIDDSSSLDESRTPFGLIKDLFVNEKTQT